jgi:hypothetical protein
MLYNMHLPPLLMQVAQAREQYQDELLDLQEKEALESEKQAREEAVAREEAELKVVMQHFMHIHTVTRGSVDACKQCVCTVAHSSAHTSSCSSSSLSSAASAHCSALCATHSHWAIQCSLMASSNAVLRDAMRCASGY